MRMATSHSDVEYLPRTFLHLFYFRIEASNLKGWTVIKGLMVNTTDADKTVEMNGYTFVGCNFTIFIFALCLNGDEL